MTWPYSSAWEKFMVAIHSMAQSPASLQQRLANAYTGSLMRLKPEDLPRELQWRFREVSKKLTRQDGYADEGVVMASALALSDKDAEEVAHKIVHIYDRLCAERMEADGA